MIACKKLSFTKLFLFAMAMMGLTGCQSVNNFLETSKVDYKSAGKTHTQRLDIPPNLTQIQRDSSYAIPEVLLKSPVIASKDALNASQKIQLSNTPSLLSLSTHNIAPNQLNGLRIERDGSQRWLVVPASPDILWSEVKAFWEGEGFVIKQENQTTGVMETDWAENRAKIPQDFLRNLLGKVADAAYSTGERDKFRTRLERDNEGKTEIYISHRGAQEVFTGPQKESASWTVRPSDPTLEAIFLSKLMVKLNARLAGVPLDEAQAREAVDRVPVDANAQLVKTTHGTGLAYLHLKEEFNQAWRRLGLALDRIGFTVEDRDRSRGIYFVRYVDQHRDVKEKKGRGFLGRLFSRERSNTPDAMQYQIVVQAVAQAPQSQIFVRSAQGQPENSEVADNILMLLEAQLK